MKLRSPLPSSSPRLQIIPLIDVMFFLLVAAFAASPKNFRSGTAPDLSLSNPSLSSHSLSTLTLRVDSEGSFYWKNEKISFEVLKDRLRELDLADPTTTVLVRGDEKADFGSVLKLINLTRDSGLEQVSIDQGASHD